MLLPTVTVIVRCQILNSPFSMETLWSPAANWSVDGVLAAYLPSMITSAPSGVEVNDTAAVRTPGPAWGLPAPVVPIARVPGKAISRSPSTYAITLVPFSTFILKSCRNRAGNVELLGVAEGPLPDEEDLLEVETRCDHLLAEGGEIVLVSAADFLE